MPVDLRPAIRALARLFLAAAASIGSAALARAGWPVNGKQVCIHAGAVYGTWSARFFDLPSGDLGMLSAGTAASALTYSFQRITPGGDVAFGPQGAELGAWSKGFPPILHGFAVDDSGCVWHGAAPSTSGKVAQLVRPDGAVLPGRNLEWSGYTSSGVTPVDAAPAPGGAYFLSGGHLQRMLRGGAIAPGWPANGASAVTVEYESAVLADGLGGAIVFAPGASGPIAKRIDGGGVLRAAALLNDDTDVDPGLFLVEPLIHSGSDAFIAGWGSPSHSGQEHVTLQRFTRTCQPDPNWANGVTAIPTDSIASVTLLPDGQGGVHVLWYSLNDNSIRGTHVLVSGQVAVQAAVLTPPGARTHFPSGVAGPARLEYVAADVLPDGRLAFAWHDDAMAQQPNIRVRWLLPDYSPDPGETERLILPQTGSGELRGVHSDGVGGAYVAWNELHPGGGGLGQGEIWMTRLLPSALEGVPGAANGPSLGLSAPRPNPVHGMATFTVTLPDNSLARLALYDLAGREVRAALVRGAGRRSVNLDALGALPPGLYLARLAHRSGARLARVVVTR